LEIGEIAHNLRSALDHLVVQLVVDNGRDPESTRTQFPIFLREDDYRQKRGRRPAHREAMLDGVAKSNKTVIDGLQPYQAGPRSARRHPLWLLREITDRDRHREPHIAFRSHRGSDGSPSLVGRGDRVEVPFARRDGRRRRTRRCPT
jgi:hypothetical protein